MGSRWIGTQGEKHHNAKLTDASVRELRELVNVKEVCVKCAINILGLKISHASAWEAANYHTWIHLKD